MEVLNAEWDESALVQKLSVYLPEHVMETLRKRAEREKRSLSNLAAYILERAVEQDKDQDSEGSS
ncbi:ribbon-helix-helix protein, CopG family [Leptolyngbya sp. FACHB-261]|nr:ribbon-helix-helix protein, CopG family [Leptolyngbya sp. FACHB-261]